MKFYIGSKVEHTTLNGLKGTVKEVNPDSEYPYLVDFGGLSEGWFREDVLKHNLKFKHGDKVKFIRNVSNESSVFHLGTELEVYEIDEDYEFQYLLTKGGECEWFSEDEMELVNEI